MGATMLSILVFLGLVAFTIAPLLMGIRAAISTVRNGSASATAVFWALVGTYLGLICLCGAELIATISHPQQEGLAAFSAVWVITIMGVPGSILPFLIAVGVQGNLIPRPWGVGSMSTWLVIGTLCWQFFLIVGLRWLIQGPQRERSRATVGADADRSRS